MQKQTESRNTLSILIDCFAPEELFAAEWEELSDEAKAYYETNHLPCEGTGVMFSGCEDCPFAGNIDYEIL